MRIIALLQNTKKIGSVPEHLTVIKALRGDDPEGNAGMIHASNLSPFLRLYEVKIGTERGADP